MTVEVARELELHFQRSRFTKPTDLVFPNPATGRPQQRGELHRRLKRTLKRAGIREELSLHGLRHTFGTRLAAAGVPLVKIQEWMEHENAETTQIYVDYQPSVHDAQLVERAFGSDPFGLAEDSAPRPEVDAGPTEG
jgi:integrase